MSLPEPTSQTPRTDAPAETDEALMARLMNGDAQALGQLYDRHVDALFATLSRRVGDRRRAEALLQEVFLSIVRARSWYRPGTGFADWLGTIADNVVRGKGGASADGQALSLDPALRDRLRPVVLHELRLTAGNRSWRTPGLFFGGFAVSVSLLIGIVVQRGPGLTIDLPIAFAVSALLMGIQLVAAWWALAPNVGPRHLGALAISAAAVVGLLFGPGLESTGPVEGTRAFGCLFVQVVVPLIPLVIGVLVLRHNAPSMVRGALVGASAGLAGAIPLYWHCANLAASHRIPHHLGGWLLIVLLGAVATRMLKPRAWAP